MTGRIFTVTMTSLSRKCAVTAILSVFFLWGGYAASQTVVSVDAKQIINEGYIGNGAQWDPYQLDYGKGRLDISEADWKKMYDRLDFMRPQFIRVMTNTTSVMQDGVLYPERGLEHLSHILDYCQSRTENTPFGHVPSASSMENYKRTNLQVNFRLWGLMLQSGRLMRPGGWIVVLRI